MKNNTRRKLSNLLKRVDPTESDTLLLGLDVYSGEPVSLRLTHTTVVMAKNSIAPAYFINSVWLYQRCHRSQFYAVAFDDTPELYYEAPFDVYPRKDQSLEAIHRLSAVRTRTFVFCRVDDAEAMLYYHNSGIVHQALERDTYFYFFVDSEVSTASLHTFTSLAGTVLYETKGRDRFIPDKFTMMEIMPFSNDLREKWTNA